MNKTMIGIIVVFGILIGAGMFFGRIMHRKPRSFSDLQERELVTIKIDEKPLQVEIVNTKAGITQGLSDRDAIGSDGMLFIFSENQVRYFWMKGMRFPLDIIWISQGKVVGIAQNVPMPAPETQEYRLPTYSSNQPTDMVLELPANSAQEAGITIGSTVQLAE